MCVFLFSFCRLQCFMCALTFIWFFKSFQKNVLTQTLSTSNNLFICNINNNMMKKTQRNMYSSVLFSRRNFVDLQLKCRLQKIKWVMMMMLMIKCVAFYLKINFFPAAKWMKIAYVKINGNEFQPSGNFLTQLIKTFLISVNYRHLFDFDSSDYPIKIMESCRNNAWKSYLSFFHVKNYFNVRVWIVKNNKHINYIHCCIYPLLLFEIHAFE